MLLLLLLFKIKQRNKYNKKKNAVHKWFVPWLPEHSVVTFHSNAHYFIQCVKLQIHCTTKIYYRLRFEISGFLSIISCQQMPCHTIVFFFLFFSRNTRKISVGEEFHLEHVYLDSERFVTATAFFLRENVETFKIRWLDIFSSSSSYSLNVDNIGLNCEQITLTVIYTKSKIFTRKYKQSVWEIVYFYFFFFSCFKWVKPSVFHTKSMHFDDNYYSSSCLIFLTI